MNYYTIENGIITESSTSGCVTHWPNCFKTSEDIVRDFDGRLYLKGELEKIKQTSEYKAKELQNKKIERLIENEQKNKDIEFISTSFGKFKTQTPLGDLKTTLTLYEKIAEANNGLPEGSLRLYDEAGVQTSNPALSLEQFKSAMLEIAMAYIAIDAKFTTTIKLINGAKNISELESIEIKY